MARLTEATRALEAERAARTTAEARAAEVLRNLAEAQRQLDAMRAELAELNRTVRADRETIEMRLADLARLSEQIRALTALRDRLEASLREQGNATQQATRLADSAQAQVALLSRQIEELRSQLSRITAALDLAETQGRDKDAQIANLGQRLNAALAAQVETLQRYRSDFFGKLREVLGNRPEIRVVGDRFVFQSEVLFPPGSAELSEAGQAQIRRVGAVLRDISRQIPREVNWVLRVDGHADRTPISNQRFASNWELSAARSIAVSRLLVQEGLPANRIAAAAFGENQPLDPGEGAEAFARNRRIEFRLTDR
jgi:chemotaxis protein MotB